MKESVKLKNVNLNLLVVLDTILKEKNVTRAAQRLFQTQSATTHSLKKLRELFKDELLVKTPFGMTPTPFMKSIEDDLNNVLAKINDLISKEGDFDPITSERIFTFVTLDYANVTLIPKLLNWISENNSSLKLNIETLPTKNYFDYFRTQKIDLILSPFNEVPPDFSCEKFCESEVVCIMRKKHPLAKKEMTLENYLQYGHVAIKPWFKYYTEHTAATKKDLKRNIKLYLPSPMAIAMNIQDNDFIATVPSTLAKYFLSINDNFVQKPFPLDVGKLILRLVWHSKHDNDPGHQWFRNKVIEFSLEDY